MVNRIRLHTAPLGERIELAFDSLDFCEAMIRINWEAGPPDPVESLALLKMRSEAIEILQEAGYLTS